MKWRKLAENDVVGMGQRKGEGVLATGSTWVGQKKALPEVCGVRGRKTLRAVMFNAACA